MRDLHSTAAAWHDAGFAPIPVAPPSDRGDKVPAIAWRDHITTRPTQALVDQWWAPGTHHGLGLIMGAVSAGPAADFAEMLELEGRAIDQLGDLKALAHDSGLGDVWDRAARGYAEWTPSGGIHFVYRVTGLPDGAPVPRNVKLATRPTPQGQADLVLAETRGEGGYIVAAPTPSVFHHRHPDVHGWHAAIGGPHTVGVITWDEREALHDLVRTLDERPAVEAAPMRPGPARTDGELTPGDDFEAKTSWADILGEHGWTLTMVRGDTHYWCRPGKNAGVSATTGHDPARDRIYVFTSSTEFEPERCYTKFGAYALLNHGGDHSAAARELRAMGFGGERPEPPSVADLIAPTAAGDPDQDPPKATGTDGPTPVPKPDATVTSLAERRAKADHLPSDDTNALAFVALYGDRVRRVVDAGKWHAWDDTRWRLDHDDAVVRDLARQANRQLPQETRDERTHKQKALSSAGLSGTVRVAASDPALTVRAGNLDAHPHLLNTPSGVLNLATGEIGPHDPDLLLSRITPVPVDLNAPHPRWTQFLDETFGGDPDLTAYVQRLAGLALLGDVREHVLPVWHGTGANGKSVTLNVWQGLLGTVETGGYAQSAPDGFLLSGPATHPTDIARMRGARLVVAAEQTSGRSFDEAKIKRLTGGDTLTGRFMHGDFFDFDPSHLIIVVTNHLPQVRDGGPSFWRRARLIPFAHTIPPDRQVPDLDAQLIAAEGPAILGWMAAGARDVLTGGLRDPQVVKAATETYRINEDSLASFLADRCLLNPHAHVKVSDLRAAYEAHCRDIDVEPLSARLLTERLEKESRVERDRGAKGVRLYKGVALLDDSAEADDEDG